MIVWRLVLISRASAETVTPSPSRRSTSLRRSSVRLGGLPSVLPSNFARLRPACGGAKSSRHARTLLDGDARYTWVARQRSEWRPRTDRGGQGARKVLRTQLSLVSYSSA